MANEPTKSYTSDKAAILLHDFVAQLLGVTLSLSDALCVSCKLLADCIMFALCFAVSHISDSSLRSSATCNSSQMAQVHQAAS